MAKYLEIMGIQQVNAKMKIIAKQYGKKFNKAVEEFADELKPDIEEETPKDTGAMVGTLRRGKDGNDIYLAMGGKETEVKGSIKKTQNYTIRQHEDLTLNHPVGQAKFMERPFLAALPTMPEKIAAKIRAKGIL